MLLVLTCAVFLLVVMPATLFWLGRMIEVGTDGRTRVAAARVQRAATRGASDPDRVPWSQRPMAPAFTRYKRPEADVAAHPPEPLPPAAAPAEASTAKSWLGRPLQPLFGPYSNRRMPPTP